MTDSPENKPLPPGVIPEDMLRKMAEAGQNMEIPGFGYQLEDDGSDLHTCALVILEKTKKDEKKELLPEKLDEYARNFDNALAIDIDNMLSNFAELYNPSDWELSTQLGNLKRIRRKFERRIQVIEGGKREGEIVENHSLDVLKGVYEKLLWAEGVEKNIAGCMISTATYFAEEDRLANIPKIKVTVEDKQKAYAEKLPGLETYKKVESLLSRSEVIKMQDDAMQITLMAAAVHQTEYENIHDVSTENPLIPVSNPRDRKEMALTRDQRALITEVFATRYNNDVLNDRGQVLHKKGDVITTVWIDPITGRGHQVPQEILQYFCMDKTSDDNKKRYMALMVSMVSMGALDRLNNLKDGETAVTIAQEIRNSAEKLLKEYYSPISRFDIKEVYANVAVRTIISQHLGDLSGGELGWGWKYEKTDWNRLEDWEKKIFEKCKEEEWVNIKGSIVKKEYVTLRVSDLGSIYAVDDIPSPMFPERHVADYQANVESTAELMWGLSDRFRREVRYHRPDWSPPLADYLVFNPFLREQVNDLLGEKLPDGSYGICKYANKLSREGYPFKKDGQDKDGKDLEGTTNGMDNRLLDYIRKYQRAWPTWVTIGGRECAIPLFYPTAWYSLNIWRSVGGSGKKAAEEPSIWERFWEGKKLSQVDYGKYAEHFTDWKNVNGAQLARVLVLLFLSYKFSRMAGGAYETYLTKIFDGKTFTDWEKRWRLGGRGEDVIGGILGLLTFSPFSTKVLIDKIGLGELVDDGTPGGEKTITRKAVDDALATTELNAMYIPKSKGTSKNALINMRGALGMFTRFHGLINYDWALKAALQTKNDKDKTWIEVNKDTDMVLRMNKIKV